MLELKNFLNFDPCNGEESHAELVRKQVRTKMLERYDLIYVFDLQHHLLLSLLSKLWISLPSCTPFAPPSPFLLLDDKPMVRHNASPVSGLRRDFLADEK